MQVEGISCEEELLRHVIHEVATSLTIILCHAQLIELEVRSEATSQISERMVKQRLNQEQDSVKMIIQQAHQIDEVMLMMADATGLSGAIKGEKEG
jgi:nicotinamide mononucleotide adenylyltransferase